MKILTEKRCVIGEGPIWNEKEGVLYFTNGGGGEICKYNPETEKLEVVPVSVDCAAFAFDNENNIYVSRRDGVFVLNKNGTTSNIYDREQYKIRYANDMKAGPDGRIYVGTQSEKRMGISQKKNGKLYSVDKSGNVSVLLDGMSLSNGMDWSLDEKYFYHTDSDTGIIKEYFFLKENGEIRPTGRVININGVDGFTVGADEKIYAACWGMGHIAVINYKKMELERYIPLSCKIPASCGFCGKDMDILAVTTASFDADMKTDKNAGFTILMKTGIKGRKPYLFGGEK